MTGARAETGAGAVSESAGHPIRKFNPGTHQSDDALIAQFAVRKHEMGIVLETLGGNIGSPSCQHMLLIGPRGMGKTMLLARVAAELRTVNALSQHLLPVRFTEESQEIFSMADFWMETLFHLANEVATDHPELAKELRATRADFAGRWRDRAIEEQARVATLSAADRLGRRLVLMVENMQSLCDNVDEDFGWKLRQTLQSEPQIMLLASATSRFETLDDAKQPFFEMFRIIGLEPLSAEDCWRLWQIAGDNAMSKREIRPLQVLTGGNPRLLVIIAGFARHRSLRQLMEDLVTLIDDHTEYFRGHLEAFPKTERRVYLALIDLWQPSAPSEIAARARMDVRVVSTMIGRLLARGVVIMEMSGKKRLYAASERLYSIYYKLRRERGEAAIVASLIRFMVAFYSESELSGMSRQLVLEAADSQSVREGWARVLAEQSRDGSAFFDKAWLPMRRMLGQVSADDRSMGEQLLGQETDTEPKEGVPMEATEIVDEDIAAHGKDTSPQSASRIAEQLCMKAIAHRQRKDFKAVVATCNEVLERFGVSDAPEIRRWAVEASVRKGYALTDLGDSKAAAAAFDEALERFGASDAPEIRRWAVEASVRKGYALTALGDSKAAAAAFDETLERFGASDAPDIQRRVAEASVLKGRARASLGDLEAAAAAFDETLERFGASDAPEIRRWAAAASVLKGRALTALGDSKAAAAAFDETLERFGASDAPEIQRWAVEASVRKGYALTDIGDSKAAAVTFDEAVERFGASDAPEIQRWAAQALVRKGNALTDIGDFEAAAAAFDETLERFGDSDAPEVRRWAAEASVLKGYALTDIGDSKAEAAAFDETLERFGASDAPEIQRWAVEASVRKGYALTDLGDSKAAVAAFDETLERFGASDAPEIQRWVAEALVRRGYALGDLGDSGAAAAAFDEALERFGDSDAPEVQERAAQALVLKGVVLGDLGDSGAAVAAFDEAVERFGDSDAPEVQERAAQALILKGVAPGDLGDSGAAVAAFDEVIERFRDSDAPDIQRWVAQALVSKGHALGGLGDLKAAVAALDEAVERFGDSDAPEVRRWAAEASVLKGYALGDLGDFEAAVATLDEALERFGASDAPEIQRWVAEALVRRGYALGDLGDSGAAAAAFDEALKRFGESDAPDIQRWVAQALVSKAEQQIGIDRLDEALRACEECERRVSLLVGNEALEIAWNVKCVRVLALMIQKGHLAATDAFCSAYASFVPGNEAMVRQMQQLVADLVVAGASAQDLADVLSRDEAKSAALVPLVVALRQHGGESVRTPTEVLEVAADILLDIEQKSAARRAGGET